MVDNESTSRKHWIVHSISLSKRMTAVDRKRSSIDRVARRVQAQWRKNRGRSSLARCFGTTIASASTKRSIWQDVSRRAKEVVSTCKSFALFYEGVVRAPSLRGCHFKFCTGRAHARALAKSV